MKFLSLFFLFFSSSVLANEVRLSCSGTQNYKYFAIKNISGDGNSHDRNFSIVFDESKNTFSIEKYKLTMCYLNPFNKENGTKEIESRVVFSDKDISFFCHSVTSSSEDKGRLSIDRYSGLVESYQITSEKDTGKIIGEITGKFNCTLNDKKQF